MNAATRNHALAPPDDARTNGVTTTHAAPVRRRFGVRGDWFKYTVMHA